MVPISFQLLFSNLLILLSFAVYDRKRHKRQNTFYPHDKKINVTFEILDDIENHEMILFRLSSSFLISPSHNQHFWFYRHTLLWPFSLSIKFICEMVLKKMSICKRNNQNYVLQVYFIQNNRVLRILIFLERLLK